MALPGWPPCLAALQAGTGVCGPRGSYMCCQASSATPFQVVKLQAGAALTIDALFSRAVGAFNHFIGEGSSQRAARNQGASSVVELDLAHLQGSKRESLLDAERDGAYLGAPRPCLTNCKI